YLMRLWEQIRDLTLKSIAPAPIYEEGDLIKRSIRDLYSKDIDEVLVEGEAGYRMAKDFMKMIMPSHAKNVRRYEEQLPLFARFQVESYLAAMFNPTIQLKSGGYIVIGVTEALVAVDVNSGRATKEGSIEETALKTNLEAAEEVARQLRLRDLAGLIVIDFIDMDERRNNAAVEKKLKDKLKTDRARIQVGRISGFGLLEMSRQRLRPGMIEATTQPCPACHGTGLIRSDDNMALSILRQIEEEGTRRRSREVLVRCPVGIANFLMNAKREHIAQIEARYGMAVRIEGDIHLVSPDFALEKFKTATRAVPAVTAPVVSVDTMLMDQVDSDNGENDTDADEAAENGAAARGENGSEGDESQPKRKRKRRPRRRRGGSGKSEEGTTAAEAAESSETARTLPTDAGEADNGQDRGEDAPEPQTAKPKSSRSRSGSSRTKSAPPDDMPDTAPDAAPEPAEAASATEPAGDAGDETGAAKKKPARTRTSRSRKKEAAPEAAAASAADAAPDTGEAVNGAVATAPAPAEPASVVQGEPVPADGDAARSAEIADERSKEGAPDAGSETDETAPPAEPDKPKRRGWWSLGR
ncbi:MAG: ribonuclease E/G, partial [Rhodobacteraceae bacterium]|nr:ribonuclease E/G [Paracoccaceae bacterium]